MSELAQCLTCSNARTTLKLAQLYLSVTLVTAYCDSAIG